MSAKQMEGDNTQRRRRARDARQDGVLPSDAKVTLGASKQRKTVRRAKREAGDADTGKQRS